MYGAKTKKFYLFEPSLLKLESIKFDKDDKLFIGEAPNSNMKTNNFITSNPNILNGTPVVAGTRIPISRILYLLSQGYTANEIKEEYSQLSVRKINEIIAIIAQQAEKGAFLRT